MAKKETVDQQIIIENATARGIELPKGDYDGDGRLDRKTLIPGENNISSSAWEKCKKNPAVKLYIAAGHLKNRGPGKAKSLAVGLDALTLAQAKDQIARCDEVKILKDWRGKTDKPRYKDLCEKRIKEIIDDAEL